MTPPPAVADPSDTQRTVLVLLGHYYAHTGEPANVSYVARCLRISRQVARRHVEALADMGLITSTSCLKPVAAQAKRPVVR